jgi:hypothetical protein
MTVLLLSMARHMALVQRTSREENGTMPEVLLLAG